jgi:hypothetical protein
MAGAFYERCQGQSLEHTTSHRVCQPKLRAYTFTPFVVSAVFATIGRCCISCDSAAVETNVPIIAARCALTTPKYRLVVDFKTFTPTSG